MPEPILTDEMIAEIKAYFPRYPSRQAVTLPALHVVNRHLRHVPMQAVVEVAQLLGLAPAEVQDTLTFYGFFKQDAAHGETRAWVCRSISCALRGGEQVLDHMCERLGIQPGETTPDGKLTLEFGECLGACEQAPCMLAGDQLHACLDSDKADAFLDKVAAGRSGEPVRHVFQLLVFTQQQAARHMPEFTPVLLSNIHTPNSHTLEQYKAAGGYRALAEASKEHSPEEIVEIVKESRLRGRGGAGFPAGVKWSFLPKDHEGPIYFCLNADESEPGTFNNRILMEDDPHQVLEGLILSCYATKASTAYYYLRYEYPRALERTQAAIDECYEHGLLGDNILGSGYSLDVYIHRGAAAYICGEETGLIESLEGKRAWPRIKPPFPAVEGVFRKPTVVNNVETVACVTHIIDRGAEWFKSMGTPADPENPRDAGSYGPKLYCLSGHVEKPGCYEAPMGLTVNQLIQEYGGGIWKGRRAKAAIPGGISMGLLTADEFDCPLDFTGPGKYDCMGLGTAAVVVMDETVSMLDYLHNSCRFFAHESCGQCTPCREGTSWALSMLNRIQAGRGRLLDLELLLEIGDNMGIMPGTTICGLADGAAWPIKNAIRKFRPEFEEFIRRTNPQGYMETEPVEALVELQTH